MSANKILFQSSNQWHWNLTYQRYCTRHIALLWVFKFSRAYQSFRWIRSLHARNTCLGIRACRGRRSGRSPLSPKVASTPNLQSHWHHGSSCTESACGVHIQRKLIDIRENWERKKLKELEHRKLGWKVIILKYDLCKSLSKELWCKTADIKTFVDYIFKKMKMHVSWGKSFLCPWTRKWFPLIMNGILEMSWFLHIFREN